MGRMVLAFALAVCCPWYQANAANCQAQVDATEPYVDFQCTAGLCIRNGGGDICPNGSIDSFMTCAVDRYHKTLEREFGPLTLITIDYHPGPYGMAVQVWWSSVSNGMYVAELTSVPDGCPAFWVGASVAPKGKAPTVEAINFLPGIGLR
jgi:hypothetical protein